MRQYLDLLENVLENGVVKKDRTGTGTISIFGTQSRYNLAEGFPLLTTKKLHLKSIIHELLWILDGGVNTKYLNDNGVRIWDQWADDFGNLGVIYGYQWRNFNGEGIDQISNVVTSLKENPDSRRHIVTAWNPVQLKDMALPPCHMTFQFYVADNKLSCHMYQRSGDLFLGVPYNIASYSLLTMMMAQVTGYNIGEFVHTIGDAHIYTNHLEQVNLQLMRVPYMLPIMTVIGTENKSIFDYKYEDFILSGYYPAPHIKGDVSV